MEKYYQGKLNLTLLDDYCCQLKINLQIHTRTEAQTESEHMKCKFMSSISSTVLLSKSGNNFLGISAPFT
jgi:hypothetical protein